MAVTVHNLSLSAGQSFDDEIIITTDFFINVVEDVSVPSWVTGDSYPNNNYAFAISGTAPSAGTYYLQYRVRDVWGNTNEVVTVTVTVSGSGGGGGTFNGIQGPTTIDLYTTSSAEWTVGGDSDSADWNITSGDDLINSWGYDGGTFYIDDFTGDTGRFTISYSNGKGDSDTLTVTIIDSTPEPTEIPISSMSLEQTHVTVTAGTTAYAYISYSPTNATDTSISSTLGSSNNLSFSYQKVSSGRIRVNINTPDDHDGGTYTTRFYLRSNSSVRTGILTIDVESIDIPPQSITIYGRTTVETGDLETYTLNWYPSGTTLRGVRWTVSGGVATLTSSASASTATLRFTAAGTTVLRATSTADSSVYDTITIVSEDPLIPYTSIDVNPSTVNVAMGDTATVVATFLPEDGNEEYVTFNTSAYDLSGNRYFNVDSEISGNVITVTVTGLRAFTGSSDRGYIRFTSASGGVEARVPVIVTPAPTYVNDITFPYSFETTFKPGESSGRIYAFAYPSDADNRGLTATVISGSGYIEIQNYELSDMGCNFEVLGVSAGTATVRVQSVDEEGYYEDLTFEIVDYIPSTGITLGGSYKIYIDQTEWIDVRGENDEDVTIEITSGSEHVQIVAQQSDRIQVLGVSAGDFTVHAVTSETGMEATRTFTVADEWPHDRTMTLTYVLNESTWPSIIGELYGYRLHGGRYTVSLPTGVDLQGETTILPEDQSDVILTSIHDPCTATEMRDVVIYAEEQGVTLPETVMVQIKVVAAGQWTKTLHFDANLPDGHTLTSPVPEDIVQELTSDEWDFVIPDQAPASDGLIFCFWEDRDDGTKYFAGIGMTITVEGEDVTKTLYAAWFPEGEGYSAVATNDNGCVEVSIELKQGEACEMDLPTFADADPNPSRHFPMDVGALGYSIDGLQLLVGGTDVSGTQGATVPSGSVVLSGTPATIGSSGTFRISDALLWDVYYTVTVVDGAQAPDTGVSIVLDANGGIFPSGRYRETIEAPDGSYRLPDWSVVDNPGYILSHWTGSQGNRGEMGSEQTVIDTWTARWRADTRAYSTEYLPHAAVRIYRALDEFIDVTFLQQEGGEPVVNLAENRPGSASMVLCNYIDDPASNLLSEDCGLWSSGSDGPIRPGMYVRIDDIRSDGTLTYLMDGFITTISPDAENLSIEIGDRITFLGKQGTTLRRNYYGDAGSRDSMLVSARHDTELYADLSELPDGATPDGAIFWTVLSSRTYDGTAQWDGANPGAPGEPLFEWTFPSDSLEYIGSVTIGMHLAEFGPGATIGFEATVESSSGDRGEASSTVSNINGDFDLTLDFGMVQVSGTVRITVYATTSLGGDLTVRTLTNASSSGRCTYSYWYGPGSDRRWATVSRDVGSTISFYTRAETEGSITGDRFIPTSIGDEDLTDSTLWTPSAHRVLVPYVMSGDQSTIDVMEGISWALGIMPLSNLSALPSSDTRVAIFRAGGGYAQDYLQKLADIASDGGRMRAYLCRGFTTPVLAIGARYMRDDTPLALLHYGGDSPSGTATRIAFASFSPSMTLKNRPSLATLRGTISSQGSTDSVPLQIAVEDVDSTEARYGVLVETVVADSSIASMGDVGNAAWAELAENELDEWEGSMVLPGIRTDLFDLTGPYAGSGVPVRVTDSRNGISDYHARVRQVKLDYNACTTTVTLSNYSMVYSSGISDTTALAITSADVATGANSTTLFNSQYVRIRTDVDQNIGDGTGVIVTGHKNEGDFEFSSVSVFILPNGRHLIHAVAPADGDGHAESDAMYDVVGVEIGTNGMLEIRPSVRPDYYFGQTLSVDIDCP